MIVVTGAAGFIGSQLAKTLASAGRKDILLVDHPLRPETASNLRLFPNANFQSHIDFIENFENGKLSPKLVFHMGACSDTTETRWEYLASNNLEYSQRLWRCCARDSAQLIYASSAATYGDGSNGFDDEKAIILLRPLNLYGRSKHEFDLWALEQVRSGAALPRQWAGLKFFNVFGPGEAHKGRMASMIFHGLNQIKTSGKIRLFQSHRADFGDGGQKRDFIYVKDVVDVMMKISARQGVNGIFNLGTGVARTFNDLAHSIFAALQIDPIIDYIPMPEDLQGKYQYFTEAKMRKLAVAGVEHQFQNLEEAVRDYVQNHLHNSGK